MPRQHPCSYSRRARSPCPCVDVQDAVGEVVDHALVVDHLPDEVRRSRLRPKPASGMTLNISRQICGVRARFVPNGTRRREQHRAVLDRDLDALAGRGRRAPATLGERAQVLGERGGGSPDERPTTSTPRSGRIDDAIEMALTSSGACVGCSGWVVPSDEIPTARGQQLADGAPPASRFSYRCARRPRSAASRRRRPASTRSRGSRIRSPRQSATSSSVRSGNAAVNSPSFMPLPPWIDHHRASLTSAHRRMRAVTRTRLDLGGTNIKWVVLDQDDKPFATAVCRPSARAAGSVLERWHWPARGSRGRRTIATAASRARNLRREARQHPLLHEPAGAWAGHAFTVRCRRPGVPVRLINDARAFTLAEARVARARMHVMIGVTLARRRRRDRDRRAVVLGLDARR